MVYPSGVGYFVMNFDAVALTRLFVNLKNSCNFVSYKIATISENKDIRKRNYVK
jgi:hypothetical protein